MKASRDRYIGRLNGIYEDGLDKLKVKIHKNFKSRGCYTVRRAPSHLSATAPTAASDSLCPHEMRKHHFFNLTLYV